MSASFHPSAGTYIEISHDALKVLTGEHGVEVPLTRSENGRLTPASRENVVTALRSFFEKHGARGWQRAFCAINARGVSLRPVMVPAAAGEELRRVLLLQIEREFPLPPSQLAWGFQNIGAPQQGNGGAKTQQVLIAAVKKELLEEYSDLFSACGLKATFTLAALARAALIPSTRSSFASLDVGQNQSELLVIQEGSAAALRTIATDLPELTKRLQSEGRGLPIYLSGENADAISRLIGIEGIACEKLEVASSAGCSAATVGLSRLLRDEATLPLTIDVNAPEKTERAVSRPAARWIVYAALLALVCFALRYAEAFIQKPRLAKRIAEIKQYRNSLPKVERDLAFLQYLKTNQPHYLDALTVVAESTAPGTRIESLSMNRRGDLSMRASMRDAQQLTDLRSKLIRSEMFSSVVVEEQSTTPDRQKLIVRMTGQWKPFTERKAAITNSEATKVNSPSRTVARTEATNNAPTVQPSAKASTNEAPHTQE